MKVLPQRCSQNHCKHIKDGQVSNNNTKNLQNVRQKGKKETFTISDFLKY